MIISSKKKITKQKVIFQHFPEFAAFILQNFLKEFTAAQIEYCREEQVPMLKFFEHYTEQEIYEFSEKSARAVLTAFIQNKIEEYIKRAVHKYKKNLIPVLELDSALAEDITGMSLVRKRSFKKFIPLYTREIDRYGNLIDELDRFVALMEMHSFNAYLEMQEEHLGLLKKEQNPQNELKISENPVEQKRFISGNRDNSLQFIPGIKKMLRVKKTDGFSDFLKSIHEGDQKMVMDAINGSILQNGLFECEFRYLVNGGVKGIWANGKVKFDSDGKPNSMKGTAIDAFHRNLHFQRIEEIENLNRQIQAISHIGNWTWDLESDNVTWSDEMYRIFGLEPQSIQINHDLFLSFIHPDDLEKTMMEIEESIQTGIVKDYLIRIINPDGKIKLIKGSGEMFANNKNEPVKFKGSCQDVTREHNLLKELEEKEKYLSQLVNNAPDGVIVFDKQGIIRFWNPKCEEIFGYPKDQMIGESLSKSIFPERYRELYNKVLLDLINDQSSGFLHRDLELKAINNEQKEFYVACRISHSPDEKYSPFIVFLRDISIQRQTKKELKSKKELLEKLNLSLAYKNTELERINKELNSFNYVASHDLQEPLRKIQLFASRILEKNGNALPNATLEYLNKIKLSTDRMKLLIEDLLAFSQTIASEDKFQMVDLGFVLNEIHLELSTSIEEKNCTIQFGNMPSIWGIPFQVQQLFANLISNAIKYCDNNITPCIEISCQMMKGNEILFEESIPERYYYQVSIKDNGIGFDQEYAEKIFGLFQRLHPKNHYSGTGIGLAICKKIMHNHNGFIKAQSLPGKGSVFHIFFPIQD